MDLGIAGKSAIVCASSKGLGRACAEALGREGVNLVINGRDAAMLAAAGQEIRRATGVRVVEVAGDVTLPATRDALVRACPEADILINNAGGPSSGDFRNWTREDWLKALDANMLTPIELIRATVDGMIARRFGRIVNITSSAVKAPIEVLGLSNGARAGLTGFVAGLARQTVRHNVTINGLLPGSFETERMFGVFRGAARASGRDPEAELAARRATIPAGRFGRPDEFGQYCAYLCSVQAAYLTGQNLLLDGGAYPGTL
ncbi:MAG: SDR family oxidoreductase [Alphaproteobacteria bacterium]|nr:SDR family oxidoreductase [Alphaproteobacteria bacterium]